MKIPEEKRWVEIFPALGWSESESAREYLRAHQRQRGVAVPDESTIVRERRRSSEALVRAAAPTGPTSLPRRTRDVTDDSTDITALLNDIRGGKREAFDQILPLVYQELRRQARRELAVRPSDTLSTTALVHELYLKFSRAQNAEWQNRAHFLAVASVAMRHILVDRARRRTAEKRGGVQRAITLDDALVASDESAESLLELHDALDHLATVNARLAQVVECRFFGGMTEQETAEALGVTERTVRRDWVKARALLQQALSASESARDAAVSETR